MSDLVNSLHIASSGMSVQSDRLKIISQNIANADNTAATPGGDPYRRKVISFHNLLDRELGVERVAVRKLGEDKSDFTMKYDPNHPAADDAGYIKLPNVDVMIEMGDLREAQRSYEANVNVVEVTKTMMQDVIGVLR
jgi:flagellar basal-body rod protein FlgC